MITQLALNLENSNKAKPVRGAEFGENIFACKPCLLLPFFFKTRTYMFLSEYIVITFMEM